MMPRDDGRRQGLANLIRLLGAAALVAAIFALPATGAAFTALTDNGANAIAADTTDPPIALTATGGATVALDWIATTDTYAEGHRIFRAASPGGPYTQVAEVTPRTTVSHVDNPPAGTFYYVARAFAGTWESANSNEANAIVGTGNEDFDAVPQAVDNCPMTFNINQYDTDSDGIGDACDPSPTRPTTGIFTDTGQTLGAATSLGVALADFDADGDLDAAFANDGPNTVWFNNGSGTFTNSGQALGTLVSNGVGVGDFDGDGDIDMTFADDPAATVWLNDGTGMFTDSGQVLGITESLGLVIGDFDGDQDLDLGFSKVNENTVWLNDGSGVFADSGQTLDSEETRGETVGDFDGDFDLDISYANKKPGTVWSNDGAGTFTDTGQTTGQGDSTAAADLDGDGDLDLAVGRRGGAGNSTWFNDGSGTFTDGGQNLSGDARGIDLGDLDGDGDIDIAYGIRGPSTVWLNDGGGTFSDSGQTLDPLDTFGVALGDVDADGDLDIVYANDKGDPNTVWLNDAGPMIGLADSWQAGLSHTPGTGSDRLLVFVASNEQQSPTTPLLTAVSYGGQPLTHIVSDEELFNSITSRVEIWILDEAGIAAAAGTTFSPTWTAAPDIPLYSHAIFEHVEQPTPTGATATGTTTGDATNPVPMSAVATANRDLVIAAATAGETGSYTPQNAFILGFTQDSGAGGSTTHGSAYKPATGSPETVSMLFNPSSPPFTNRQVVLAMVLNAAP